MVRVPYIMVALGDLVAVEAAAAAVVGVGVGVAVVAVAGGQALALLLASRFAFPFPPPLPPDPSPPAPFPPASLFLPLPLPPPPPPLLLPAVELAVGRSLAGTPGSGEGLINTGLRWVSSFGGKPVLGSWSNASLLASWVDGGSSFKAAVVVEVVAALNFASGFDEASCNGGGRGGGG